MARVIVAAAVIFAFAALVLQRSVFQGPFAEPALLVTMGSFFLLASRVVSGKEPAEEGEKQPSLIVPDRHRVSV